MRTRKHQQLSGLGRATYARIKSIQLGVAMKMLCIRNVLYALMETSEDIAVLSDCIQSGPK